MFYLRLVVVFLCLLIFPLQSAWAGIVWEQTGGPYGGYGRSIAISKTDPNIIFLGTIGAGIYKSVDGGHTWVRKVSGIDNPSFTVFNIEIDPTSSDIVYACPNTTGLYKSTDGGESWQLVGSGITDGSLTAIAVDPRDTSDVYVINPSEGILKSINGGVSFTPLTYPSGGDTPTCLEIVAADGHSAIYLGTLNTGVYKSINEGASWVKISQNDSRLNSSKIWAIAPAPSSPESWVYVGASDTQRYCKKTTDGGGTWETMSFGSNNYVEADIREIKVTEASPEVAYLVTSGAGFYKTAYSGGKWKWLPKSVNPKEDVFWSVGIHPTNESTVYCSSTGRAFYISTDEANSFEFSNEGIKNVRITSLLAVPSSEGTIIIAGTYPLGTFRSGDLGNTWEQCVEGMAYGEDAVYCLAQVPATPIVFAGASDGVYKSSNYGVTWEALTLSVQSVRDIKVDPISSEVIYASSFGGSKFYRSLDSGDTWSAWNDGLPVSTSQIYHFIVSTDESGTCLHVKAQNPEGVYRRYSYTGQWEKSYSGSIADQLKGYSDAAFFPDYSTSESVLAGVGTHLIKKQLDSDTWVDIIGGFGVIEYIDGDPADLSTIYLSTSDRDVWRVYNYMSSRIREINGLEPYNVEAFRTARRPLILDYHSVSRSLFAEVGGRSVWRAQITAGDPPLAPSGLVGTAVGSHEIQWDWIDNSFDELGFYLYDGLTIVSTIAANDRSTLESGLSVNSPYQRRIAAYNDFDETTSGLSPIVHTLSVTPGIPLLDSAGVAFINITWEALGNPPGTKYIVESSTVETGSGLPVYWNVRGSTEAYPPAYHDSGLEPSTVYYYRLRAENHDGIQTELSGQASFETLPPVPSLDVVSPEITSVEFDGRPYFRPGMYGISEIIHNSPRISATITDYGSTEPGSLITPEGVDISSVRILFGSYVFENEDIPDTAFSLSSTETIPVPPGSKPVTVYLDYSLQGILGATGYTCTIEARDLAFPLRNLGTWEGDVTVLEGDAEVIGEILAYPSPYRPLSQGDVIITYNLTVNSDITLYMYDISGKIILTKKFLSGTNGGKAGYNSFEWNGRSDFGHVVSNGIHVFKIVSKGRSIGTGKLVVMD